MALPDPNKVLETKLQNCRCRSSLLALQQAGLLHSTQDCKAEEFSTRQVTAKFAQENLFQGMGASPKNLQPP